MLTVQCPNCGARVTFRAGETVFAVCSYCQSTLVRDDVKVESIGKMAILQDSWSPLQLMTEGDFDGGHFFLFGRVTYRWERGTWTEWYASFNDGRSGWMTEAQGFYALSFEVKADLPPADELSAGTRIDLNGTRFTVQDIKEAEVAYSEGELPFKAVPGRKSKTIDLVGPSGAFASLEYADSASKAFIGSYKEFDELHLQNLRQLDGW
jgi:hypothetical protein